MPDNPDEARGTAEIRVDAARPRHAFSPLLFGANHRYTYRGFGTYDPRTDRVDPRFARAVRETGITMLRFPGGTVANTYRWRDGTGPAAERARVPHGSTGEPVDTEYGTDEHLRFTASLGMPNCMVVNFATGTAREAADWVRHVNAPGDGARPTSGGERYWEVANEPYLRNQRYWMGPGTPDDVAEQYAFGGTRHIADQPVARPDDHRDAAALADGTAGQRFVVRYPPIRPDSQVVRVDGRAWTPVADLATRHDEDVYTVDPGTGVLTFGDGVHGNRPAAGRRVTADYDSGPHDGFVDYYRLMKAADPAIRVCTSLDSERLIELLGDEHPYDAHVIHQYSGTPFAPVDDPRNRDPNAVHDKLMAEPRVKAAEITRVRELIRRHAPHRADRIEIIVTEYGLLFLPLGVPGPTEGYHASMDQALYVAQSLTEYAELGVPVALKHTVIDQDTAGASDGAVALGPADQAVIGAAPHYLPSATALLMRLLRTATGIEVVHSDTTGDPVRPLPDGGELTALRTLATVVEGGTIHLWIINRDRETDVSARIRLHGAERIGRVSARVLRAEDFTAVNTLARPDAVTIADAPSPLADTDGWTCVFEAHSVTVLTFAPGSA